MAVCHIDSMRHGHSAVISLTIVVLCAMCQLIGTSAACFVGTWKSLGPRFFLWTEMLRFLITRYSVCVLLPYLVELRLKASI